MKELWTDGMMEVSMEKLKGNLLARKMETMKGQIVRKMDFYMVLLMEFKMVRYGISDGSKDGNIEIQTVTKMDQKMVKMKEMLLVM